MYESYVLDRYWLNQVATARGGEAGLRAAPVGVDEPEMKGGVVALEQAMYLVT